MAQYTYHTSMDYILNCTLNNRKKDMQTSLIRMDNIFKFNSKLFVSFDDHDSSLLNDNSNIYHFSSMIGTNCGQYNSFITDKSFNSSKENKPNTYYASSSKYKPINITSETEQHGFMNKSFGKNVVYTIIAKLLIEFNQDVHNKIKSTHKSIFSYINEKPERLKLDDITIITYIIAYDMMKLGLITIDEKTFSQIKSNMNYHISRLYNGHHKHWVYNLFISQYKTTNMKYVFGMSNSYIAEFIYEISTYHKGKSRVLDSVKTIYDIKFNHSDYNFLEPYFSMKPKNLVEECINPIVVSRYELVNSTVNNYISNITKLDITTVSNLLFLPYILLLEPETYKTFELDQAHNNIFNIDGMMFAESTLYDFLYSNLDEFSELVSMIIDLIIKEFYDFASELYEYNPDDIIGQIVKYHFLTNAYISNMNMLLDSYVHIVSTLSKHYNIDFEYYFNKISWSTINNIDCEIEENFQHHFTYINRGVEVSDSFPFQNIIYPVYNPSKAKYDKFQAKGTLVIGVITTLFNQYHTDKMKYMICEEDRNVIWNLIKRLSNKKKLIK